MFRWLWRLLYESTPAEFRSAFGLEESVERLRAATKRSVFSAMSETAAVGKVSEESVRLQRVIPMVGNSFKPFFIGRFEVINENVVLAGRFTMLPLIKAFMTVWFGMVTFISIVLLIAVTKPVPPPAMLAPFAMIGGGLAMLAFAKWLARNDVAWLSTVIEGALQSPGAAVAARGTTTPVDPAAVPMTLKGTAIFLAASGAMTLFSGWMMAHLPPAAAHAGGVSPFPPLGDWSLVYAALVFALALGVWRRRPWAWWGLFVLLGASACWSVYATQTTPEFSPPMGMRVIFAVMSCAVLALWGRWWYAQRKHFIRN